MSTIKLTFLRSKQMRWYSTKQKMMVIDNVNKLLINNELKHRNHPGVVKPRQVKQPGWLKEVIQMILHDQTISPKVINISSKKLVAHLNGRHIPFEKEDFMLKIQEVKDRMQVDGMKYSKEDVLHDPKAANLLKTLVYNWAPISYDKYTCLAYLVGRSVPEYSILYKIFNEIVNNDKNFVPRTLFDYGSGVGTVMWAASQFWIDSIKEYYCVDTSRYMNDLSEYILKHVKPQIKSSRVFYRQFLPASPIPSYDIIVSAYSLMELPNQKSRLEVISKLWYKTEQYLVIVEQGTRAGFKVVNEARDFILNYQKDTQNGHVFLPCPHDLQCPRYMEDDTPCNFEISYLTLPIGEKSMYKYERYSYIVFKKGKRSEDDCKWPRIVRPILRRSKHVICRMCTASGKLEEQIFTTYKNGCNTYRCARQSEWGDRLPFEMEETKETEESE